MSATDHFKSANRPLSSAAPISLSTMSLNGHPSATPAQPLPPLPAGWGGPPSTPSPYQLPPAPTNSDGWGSSPTTVPRSDDTPLPQTYTPSSSHDGYNTLFPAPIIKPLFIDTLARDMKLEEGQRQNLHDFVQVCPSRLS